MKIRLLKAVAPPIFVRMHDARYPAPQLGAAQLAVQGWIVGADVGTVADDLARWMIDRGFAEPAPAVPEPAPAVPEPAPAVPESAPAVPESAPAVPESAPAVPESAPTAQG